MTAPRIADAPSKWGASGPQGPLAPKAPPRALSSWGERLSSPAGVMLVVPLLVGSVGLFVTAVGQRALHDSNLEVARARMGEQAAQVATSVSDALLQADPMLDRMIELAEAHDPEQPFEGVAHALVGLMRGRPGVTYLSISFPDGTFQGAYLDEDGALRFQVSRVLDATRTRVQRYHVQPGAGLSPQREETTGYDPREREFYKLALRSGARAWTEPYPFYVTNHTGITRVSPVYRVEGASRRLHAVVTVDFDVHGLSEQLVRHRLDGTKAALFARDGAVLAYAAAKGQTAELPAPGERVLSYRDLNDPVLAALFEAAAGSKVVEEGPRAIEVAGDTYMAAFAPIAPQLGLPWTMAYVAAESLFLRDLFAHRRSSLWIAGLGLLLSVALAWLFARSITRVRAEAASARADAHRARERAKELGSYRLVSRLGQGAMGEVWRAEHRLLARQAAIKLIHPSLHGKDTPEVRERFRREAQTLATLRSRNTIELFDYGVAEDGTFFFVMELLDGMDLETLVDKHGPQPVDRVVPLLQQACASLAEAHDRGLVHRDVKPANLFVCRAADEVDVVKVLDFGLVLGDAAEPLELPASPSDASALIASGKLTQPNGLMGTPAFIPPEQAASQPLDGRADVYALGCVGLWLLSGRQLYPHDNPMQLLVAHLSEPVPDLRRLLPAEVPDALVRLLTRCVQKLPQARPAGMRELSAELAKLPRGEGWTEAIAQAWWQANHAATAPSDQPDAVSGKAATVLSIAD